MENERGKADNLEEEDNMQMQPDAEHRISQEQKSRRGRPPKKDYDPEALMQELIDTVAEVYHNTNEIKAAALELSFPPNKVKSLNLKKVRHGSMDRFILRCTADIKNMDISRLIMGFKVLMAVCYSCFRRMRSKQLIW